MINLRTSSEMDVIARAGSIIAGLMEELPGRVAPGASTKSIDAFAEEYIVSHDGAVAAFRDDDEDAARQLMHDYNDDIRRHYRRLEDGLVGGEVDLDGGTAAALALYLRFLKRISAHARNLVSSVVNPFHRIGYNE